MRISKDACFLIILFAVAIALSMMFTGTRSNSKSDVSTTYSTGAQGVKAFYTLLGDRLGYNVSRLNMPYTEMPRDVGVLVVVQPVDSTPISPDERDALNRWVRSGGTAIFISDSVKKLPSGFRTTRRLDKGFVYVFGSRKVVTNSGLKDYRNAIPLIEAISAHSASGGRILFDEYHHGFGTSKTAALLMHTSRQVKAGAVIVIAALVALGYGKARRFGAVRSLPNDNMLRPEFEYVESVARLYERANANNLTADILIQSLRQRLCQRFSLPQDASRQAIVQHLQNQVDEPTAQYAGRLLDDEHASRRLSKSDMLSIAQQVHSLESRLFG